MEPDVVLGLLMLFVAFFGLGFQAGLNRARRDLRSNASRLLRLLDEQRRG